MTRHLTPREAATSMERGAVLPDGADERVTGYGVIGLPFASGHYLALRDFVASSFGPPYRSVWHRDPAGAWTVYSNAAPEQSCARYLGSALAHPPVTTPIDVTWPGDAQMRIYIDDVLDWTVAVRATPATRLMSAMGGHLPDSAWTNRAVLATMGRVAGPLLSAGRMRLSGAISNGQEFRAAPRRIWAVQSSRAILRGHDFGPVGRLAQQERLGGFWLPQRGIFFTEGVGHFESFDPARHADALGAR